MRDRGTDDKDKRRVALTLLLVAGCLFLILAGAVLAITLDGLSKVHKGYAEYQKNADRVEEASKQDVEQSCFSSDFATYSECVREKLATYYEAQAANQDIQAQKDMAWWALTLFVLGTAQTAIGIAGIYFVKANLDEMKRARETSSKAVAAAHDANELAKEAIAGDRAWVLFEIIEVIPSGTSADDKSNPAKELIIVAKFKNFGKTPSLNTGIIHTVRGVPIGEETSPLFDKPLVVPESGGAVVAPGAALYADEIRIPENLVNLFRAKKVRIDLCVFVGYRDLFNKKKLRTTVTVIKILHNGFEVDPNGQRFDRTESSLSDPRNGAD